MGEGKSIVPAIYRIGVDLNAGNMVNPRNIYVPAINCINPGINIPQRPIAWFIFSLFSLGNLKKVDPPNTK